MTDFFVIARAFGETQLCQISYYLLYPGVNLGAVQNPSYSDTYSEPVYDNVLTVFLQFVDNLLDAMLQTLSRSLLSFCFGLETEFCCGVDVVILGGSQWLLPEGRLRAWFCPRQLSLLCRVPLTPSLHSPENMVCDVRLVTKLGRC